MWRVRDAAASVAGRRLGNEISLGFNTASMRNIYSPNVVCAQELIVDQLAGRMGLDPVEFRRAFLADSRLLAVLNAVASAGSWGKSMPAGTAQGIAVHAEYQAAIAILAEIDCTAATVNRIIASGVTGPRVTKVIVAVDPGLAVNLRGLEAQMIGGVQDGIAVALTSSLHIAGGLPLEGSGKEFNPCSVRVSDIQPADEITTIEGLPATVGAELHPMQRAWLDYDVAQCGYCQPGQIMAAVALVKQAAAEGHDITDADLDTLRNICRCGTYSRIREAIKAGAKNM
jgi:aerobic-type carbon monoxide dehydrogenase small subunit (CoxS/CutS family)